MTGLWIRAAPNGSLGGPVIANSTEPEVEVWDYEEGRGRVRTYVWLRDHDYLVVLEKRQKRIGLVAFLVTAFHIDGPGKRADLEKKLAIARSLKMQAPAGGRRKISFYAR